MPKVRFHLWCGAAAVHAVRLGRACWCICFVVWRGVAAVRLRGQWWRGSGAGVRAVGRMRCLSNARGAGAAGRRGTRSRAARAPEYRGADGCAWRRAAAVVWRAVWLARRGHGPTLKAGVEPLPRHARQQNKNIIKRAPLAASSAAAPFLFCCRAPAARRLAGCVEGVAHQGNLV
jgi:hypothetical protein